MHSFLSKEVFDLIWFTSAQLRNPCSPCIEVEMWWKKNNLQSKVSCFHMFPSSSARLLLKKLWIEKPWQPWQWPSCHPVKRNENTINPWVVELIVDISVWLYTLFYHLFANLLLFDWRFHFNLLETGIQWISTDLSHMGIGTFETFFLHCSPFERNRGESEGE